MSSLASYSSLNGKAILVTGAASGIGKATAEAFAREGSRVALADWDEHRGEAVARALSAQGAEVFFQRCDVSQAKDVQALIKSVVQRFGRLDYAFNNAGIEGDRAFTAECSEENWDRVLAVNLKGIWLCMKYEIPEMLKVGAGSIVNCASIAGLVGFNAIPAYTASKHGVVGLTKTTALDYAKSGLRVNAVCPGVIQTPMIDRFTGGDPKVAEQFAAAEPVGRVGQPKEIADAVLWLCSDRSTFVTGQAIAVDGGWIAQ